MAEFVFSVRQRSHNVYVCKLVTGRLVIESRSGHLRLFILECVLSVTLYYFTLIGVP